MFSLLPSSTIKNCLKSNSVIKVTSMDDTEAIMCKCQIDTFAVSKNNWDGKSMKNVLYILWCAKRHLKQHQKVIKCCSIVTCWRHFESLVLANQYCTINWGCFRGDVTLKVTPTPLLSLLYSNCRTVWLRKLLGNETLHNYLSNPLTAQQIIKYEKLLFEP